MTDRTRDQKRAGEMWVVICGDEGKKERKEQAEVRRERKRRTGRRRGSVLSCVD